MSVAMIQKSGSAPRRRRSVRYYGSTQIPFERVESYANILLREIKRSFGDALFFTRDDITRLSILGHVGIASQYHTACLLVRFLCEQGDLVEKSRTDLCIKNRERGYIDQPLHIQFFNTIQKIVLRTNPAERQHITVMDIVYEWKTDPHLTTNNKRVAVRGAMPRLVKEGVITKRDEVHYALVQGAHQ